VVAEKGVGEGGRIGETASSRKAVGAVAADDANAHPVLLDRTEGRGSGAGIDRPVALMALGAGPELEARRRGGAFRRDAAALCRACADQGAQHRRRRQREHSPAIVNATHASNRSNDNRAAMNVPLKNNTAYCLRQSNDSRSFRFVPCPAKSLPSVPVNAPSADVDCFTACGLEHPTKRSKRAAKNQCGLAGLFPSVSAAGHKRSVHQQLAARGSTLDRRRDAALPM
jgi:hypothetical protein